MEKDIMTVGSREFPEHPDFYFRLTGDWKGWHNFLGEQSINSEEADEEENMAYKEIINQIYDTFKEKWASVMENINERNNIFTEENLTSAEE